MSTSYPAGEDGIHVLLRAVEENPYSPNTRLKLALQYASFNYPDLAAGEAYMALLLCDEIYDHGAEFHEEAFEAASGDADTTPEDKLKDLSLGESDGEESASSPIE